MSSHLERYREGNIHTVTSRYTEAGYNEVPAYIEMELFPQSTKCIHFHPFITKHGYIEGIHRSLGLRYNGS